MFGLGRQSRCAVLALVRLAEAGSEPVSARVLAASDGSSPALLGTLMKRLSQAGLVVARRGPGGGYRLARPADRIRLAQVIQAVEGGPAVRLATCCGGADTGGGGVSGGGGGAECRVLAQCPIKHAIRRLNDRVDRMLGRASLAELLDGGGRGVAGAMVDVGRNDSDQRG
ncbi:MAG: Rrf2 family transcriptional regulator [Phycisphaeraceae bacterium]